MDKHQNETFQKDLTQGSVAKHLILFSLPFLASNFLQALYSMGDMFFVGRYGGPVGASAVGIGGQVMYLTLSLIGGLTVGGTVLIAQLFGAKRQDQLSRTIGTMFSLYGIAALAMTALMLALNPLILRPLATTPEVYEEALRYVNVCTLGLLPIFGYNGVSAVLRGMGDSRHPLAFVTVAALLNVALDALFCGPMGRGAAGAAWATVISQGVSFLLSVLYLRRRKFLFDFSPRSFRLDRELARKLLKIGLPSSIQGTLVTFSFMVLMAVAGSIAGVVGSTALSITGRVNSMAILPAFAMQAAVSSMAGQNLGAGKHRRAFRTMATAVGITLGISVALFLLVRQFATPIVQLFLGDIASNRGGLDPETARQCVEQSALYLRNLSWDYLLVSFVFNIAGLAIAAGQTRFAMATALVSSLLVRAPMAWLLGKTLDLGLANMAFAATIATAVTLIIQLIYLAAGVWKKGKLVRPEDALPEGVAL
ncbi:MAG: MATE family efflux transporter [Oscillospiraceae bacterium]|nr:MATE family efflux transporter [Oscillospiraceae bacterium]